VGRPIKKTFFGSPVAAGTQFTLTSAFIPGAGSATSSAYIVSQKGTGRYVVSDGVNTGIVKLIDGTGSPVLVAGQAYMAGTVYGSAGTGATAGTVRMRTVSGSINAGGTGYTTGNVVTVIGGTGTSATFTVTAVAGVVTALTLTTPGSYTALPTLTGAAVTGGSGTGLTLNLVFGVLSVAVSAGGSGYNTASVVFSGSNGAAANATVVSGVVTAITVTSPGTGYTSIPTVTISGTAVTEYVKVLNQRSVKTFQNNEYRWLSTGAVVVGDITLPLS